MSGFSRGSDLRSTSLQAKAGYFVCNAVQFIENRWLFAVGAGLYSILCKQASIVYNAVQMPAASELSSVIDRQLLLQLGARLKSARLAQDLTTTEMARRAKLSRMTLSAIESGEPSATMGSYVRVMSVLGVSKDLVLLASDSLVPPGDATEQGCADSGLMVSASNAKHEVQDLQSLVLHQEAVRRMQAQPELIEQALDVLQQWRQAGPSRSQSLWDEWADILHRRAWRRALANTSRSRELRQASPLATVLPEEVRQRILEEVQRLKKGVSLGTVAQTSSRRPKRGTANGA